MNKIGQLLAVLFLARAFGGQTTEECRLSDISTIIGGRDYSVDEMRGTYFEYAGRYMLLAFGRLTLEGVSQGFLFLYDYVYCESSEMRLLQNANKGIREAIFGESILYVLGYDEQVDGTMKEILTYFQLGIKTRAGIGGRTFTILRKDPDYQFRYETIVQGLVLNQGMLLKQTSNQIYVVKQDRITFYDLNYVVNRYDFTVIQKSNFIACDSGLDYTVLLSDEDFGLRLTDFENSELVTSIYTGYSIKSHAKLIAKRRADQVFAVVVFTLQDELRVLGHTIASSVVQQVILQQKFRTLHLSFENNNQDLDEETTIFFVAIDDNNSFHAIKIKLNENALVYATIESHFSTKPIDFVAFDRELPHIVRSSRNWDLWLFSTTDSMLFFGEAFTFSNSVGFIMSTEKNRLTQFWEQQPTDFALTYEDGFVYSYEKVEKDYFLWVNFYAELLLDIFFERKNDWIYEQNACRPDLGIKDVDSTCYVYDIFYKQPAAVNYLDLQSLSKNVPRKSSSCDQGERLLYYLYEDMTLGQKVIRNACFPKQKEILSHPSPPVTNEGKAMVNIDQEKFQLSWINEASRELDQEVWSVQIEEFDDLKSSNHIAGFKIKAQYQVTRVSHINVDFEISRPLEFSFFPKDQAYDFQVSVICWSLKCPSYLKQNEHSMYSEMGNERVVDGTFVYFVEITQLSQTNVTKFTVSFNVTQKLTSLKNTVGINITDDFQTWYAANKKNLPYYAPTINKEIITNTTVLSIQLPESDKASNFKEADGTQASNVAEKSDLLGQLDPKTFQFVKEWSTNDILLAVQEARQRLNQKHTVNIPTLTLSSAGLLTVAFMSDIQLPSYLRKELNALIVSEQVKIRSYEGKKYRGLGLFQVSTFQIEQQKDFHGISDFGEKGCIEVQIESCYLNAYYYECGWLNFFRDEPENCGYEYCNPQTDEKCTPFEPQCNSAWHPECFCGEEKDGVWHAYYPDDPDCIERAYNQFCHYGRCRKDYCDPKTDDTCFINENCKGGMDSGCTYYNRCDPLTDATCGNKNCDPSIHKGCKKPVLDIDCDQNNPNCHKYVKLVDKPVLQELPKVEICDQSDPKSDCYRPPLVVAQTPCFETQYFDEQTGRCIYYEIYFGAFEQLFKVEALSRDQEGRISEQGTQSLKFTKQIVSATNREIVIQLQFENVIDETHNEFIRVTTNFASFNLGITVSESEIALPKYMFKPNNKALGKISEASKSVVVTAAIGTAVMRTSMQASLSQLWGMINGIQFIIHIPCINLDFPTNSFTVLKQLIAVATFELPLVNLQALKGKWKVEKKEVLIDLPKNVISSMDQLGYNDANISNTMGTGYLIILVVIIGLLTILVTLPCSRFQFCSRLNQWLRKQLLWNFIIRLLLEQSLEITYSIVLTFKYGSFSNTAFGTAIDYIIAALLALSVASLPVFMAIFYLRNYGNWESEEFEETYGAPLKGLKKTQKSSLVYPVYFVIRRAIFCFTTLFVYDNVVIQLYIHHLLTMGSIAYLVSYVPQEEPLEFRLELMNEYFTVFAIDLCFLFTDLDSNRIRQYNWGYVLVVTIVICVGVHAFFLFRNMITVLIKTVKKARKKGWMKTFPSLQRVQHILRVLACRTKFDISRLKEKQESSDESDQKKSDKPSQISEAEQSVNEDEEAPTNQPSLLRNPANDDMTNNNQPTLLQSPDSNETRRNQSLFCQNAVSDSFHQVKDRFDGFFEVKTVGQMPTKRDHRHEIEDEDLVKANKSSNPEVRDHFDLNSKCDYIANEILSSNDIASVDNVQDIEEGPYNPETGRLQKSSAAATLNELRPHLLRSLERSDATVGLKVTVNMLDSEVEAQVSSTILFERMQNLQVNPDVPEREE